jgi:serine/threonine protein phosphatase PrpC
LTRSSEDTDSGPPAPAQPPSSDPPAGSGLTAAGRPPAHGPSLVLGRPSPAAAGVAELRPNATALDAAYRADGGDGDWCAVRAASVAGVRHRLSGQPGQDSYAWALAGDRLAVAVADGLGGVPDSDTTAARATTAAVSAALASSGALADQVAAGLDAANRAARGGGATTIVIAVIHRRGEVAVARVGDSSAFVVGEGGAAWTELFASPASDGLNTVTAALPAVAPQSEEAAISLDYHGILVLATDGISDPWRDGPTTVAPALASALAVPLAPLDLAQLVDFSRQGCHDDRTLVAVWHRAGAHPA